MSNNKNQLAKKGYKMSTQEPRALEEIRKEYNEVNARAGDSQYKAYAFTMEVAELNKRLLALNQEANARQALDTPKTEEVK